MKQFSTPLALLLFVSVAHGQNNFFLPFGQSTDEVKSYLVTKDYVNGVQEDAELRSLRVNLDELKHLEYAFNEEGMLYATTVTRHYQSHRAAREIEGEVLEYMKVASQGHIRHVVNGNLTCYTALADTRVIKLFVLEHKTSRTLTLTSMSKLHGPPLDEKDIYYEDDILNKRFISTKPPKSGFSKRDRADQDH